MDEGACAPASGTDTVPLSNGVKAADELSSLLHAIWRAPAVVSETSEATVNMESRSLRIILASAKHTSAQAARGFAAPQRAPAVRALFRRDSSLNFRQRDRHAPIDSS